MALKRTHIAVSEACALSYLVYTTPPLLSGTIVLTGVFFGAQFPDIDQSNTKINRQFGLLGKMLGKLKHRTWTHTIWIVGLLFALAYFIPVQSTNVQLWLAIKLLCYSFATGYLLHLIEDDFSIQGVCWFYPFTRFKRSRAGHYYKRRKFHYYYYRTGGSEEKFIFFIAVIIDLILLVYLFQIYTGVQIFK